MSEREDLSPRFSISYSAPESFPAREVFGEFGYEPFDTYLCREVSEDVLGDPRLFMEGEGARDFLDDFRRDYLLIFRYKRKDFDPAGLGTAPDVETPPDFKGELYKASLEPGQRFLELVDVLEGSVDEVTEIVYTQALDTKKRGQVVRPITPGEYLEEVSGAKIQMSPDTYGLNEIELCTEELRAVMYLYRDEVKVPVPNNPGFGNYNLFDSGSDAWEEVTVDRDDEEIDTLQEELESSGFEVERDFLPGTVSPKDV